MNTAQYRDNAFTPEKLNLLLVLGSLASDIVDVVDVNFEEMTYEEYKEWVEDWKVEYQLLSLNIVANKKNQIFYVFDEDAVENGEISPENLMPVHPVSDDPDIRAAYVAQLKKFANTLLNAREYGKRVRYQIQQRSYKMEAANEEIDELHAARA